MKVISAVVGASLLGISISLAYLASNNANEMINKKDAIITKYINQSNQALENNNINNAKRFAKSAIVVDPKSKKAFDNYENIIKLQYAPNINTNVNIPASAPVPTQAAEEYDMGC